MLHFLNVAIFKTFGQFSKKRCIFEMFTELAVLANIFIQNSSTTSTFAL